MGTLFFILSAICAYLFKAITIIAMILLLIAFIKMNVEFIKENCNNK